MTVFEACGESRLQKGMKCKNAISFTNARFDAWKEFVLSEARLRERALWGTAGTHATESKVSEMAATRIRVFDILSSSLGVLKLRYGLATLKLSFSWWRTCATWSRSGVRVPRICPLPPSLSAPRVHTTGLDASKTLAHYPSLSASLPIAVNFREG